MNCFIGKCPKDIEKCCKECHMLEFCTCKCKRIKKKCKFEMKI